MAVSWDSLQVRFFRIRLTTKDQNAPIHRLIASPDVLAHIKQLAKHIDFGSSPRGLQKAKIIEACLAAKHSRYTRENPPDIKDWTSNDFLCRAISKIARDLSFSDGPLHKWTEQDGFDLVYDLISKIRQDASPKRNGFLIYRQLRELFEGKRREAEDPSEDGILEDDDSLNDPLVMETVAISEDDHDRSIITILIANETETGGMRMSSNLSSATLPRQDFEGLPTTAAGIKSLLDVSEKYLSKDLKHILLRLDKMRHRPGAIDASDLADFMKEGETHEANSTSDLELRDPVSTETESSNVHNTYDIFRGSTNEEHEHIMFTQSMLAAHCDKGPSYESILHDLQVPSSTTNRPYIPNTNPAVRLYPYQLQGIGWILQQCLTGPGVAILGDAVGLGKTLQILCMLVAYVDKRKRCPPEDRVNKYGPARPSIIIVPSHTLSTWIATARHLTALFNTINIIPYSAQHNGFPEDGLRGCDILVGDEASVSDVYITTYTHLGSRHSSTIEAKWSKHQDDLMNDEIDSRKSTANNVEPSGITPRKRTSSRISSTGQGVQLNWDKDYQKPVWPQDLSNKFLFVIVDEAHMLKAGHDAVRASTIIKLRGHFKVLLSATIIDNNIGDLKGIMQLVDRNYLWERHHKNACKDDPFLAPADDPFRVCCATDFAFTHSIMQKTRELDAVELGLRIQVILNDLYLRRSYDTKFRGRLIGHDIPPMRVVHVETTHTDEAESRFLRLAKPLGLELMTLAPGSKFGVKFHLDVHRKLLKMALWTPLYHITDSINVRDIAAFRSDTKHDLRAFLSMLIRVSGGGGLHFPLQKPLYIRDPPLPGEPSQRATDIEMVSMICIDSPLIRMLLGILRHITVPLKRRLIVWTDWPICQLLVELVVRACGINVRAFHSGLNDLARDGLVRDFNDSTSDIQVLVMSTDVAATGINLQHACSEQVMLGTTASDQQQMQAFGRIHRCGQTRKVVSWVVSIEEGYGSHRRLKRYSKGIADMVAHLKLGRNDDIQSTIETMWKDMNGTSRMPSPAPWLPMIAGGTRFEDIFDGVE